MRAFDAVPFLLLATTPLARAGFVETDHAFPGQAAGDRQAIIEFIGDYDGDGSVDIAIGAPGADLPGKVDCGRVTIRSGADPNVVLFDLPGQSAGEELGFSLAAGHLDDDGVLDVVAGAPGAPFGGRVYVLYAGTTAVCQSHLDVARFGHAVAVLDEGPFRLLVGAPDANGQGGMVMLREYLPGWFGAWHHVAGNPGDQLGASLTVLGDFVLIGAPGANGGAGRVDRCTSKKLQPAGSYPGSYPGERFGHAVRPAGHVDGDGKIDLLVGAPLHAPPGQPSGGRAVVLSGATMLVLQEFKGSPGDEYGAALAAGDVDGDGYGDFLIGAPGANQGAGRIDVISGRTLTTATAVHGGAPDELGRWLGANTVDLDHDGDLEVTAGAPGAAATAGAAYVLSGRALCAKAPSFGTGCPGWGYSVPVLTASGCRVTGGTLTLSLDQANPKSNLALLVLGTGPTQTPLGFLCTLHVGPVLPLLIPIPIVDASPPFLPPLPGAGQGALTATLPPLPEATVYVQAFVVDPDAPFGLGYAGTNAVTLEFAP